MADPGAVIALIDSDDQHHETLRSVFEAEPGRWVLPWAILPEVDYLASFRLGATAAKAFRADLADGLFDVEWNRGSDLQRAGELDEHYADLSLGLVDTVAMAIAERLDAQAIATLDLRDFAFVELAGRPALWPRDL